MTERKRAKLHRNMRHRGHPKAPLAVIDVGTNSALLLIVRFNGEKFVTLHEESQTPRLGAGLAETGRIAVPSITSLIDILRHYQQVCDSYGVVNIIPVGTRVFRVARNSKRVLKEVARRTGLEIDVLSGVQEASYALLGALSGLPRIQNGVLIDVGGGSTEFVVFKKREIIRSVSFPLGAVVLAETALRRFRHISDVRLARARTVVEKHFCHLIPEFYRFSGCMIGVGGTITTLAAMDRRNKKYRPDRIQGIELTREKFDRYLNRFRRLKIADIQQAIPFDPARASVLPAGTFIWAEVLKHLCAKSVVVSHRGLRWGVAVKFFGRSGCSRG